MTTRFARYSLAALLILLALSARAENGYQWSWSYPTISWFDNPQDACNALMAYFDASEQNTASCGISTFGPPTLVSIQQYGGYPYYQCTQSVTPTTCSPV